MKFLFIICFIISLNIQVSYSQQNSPSIPQDLQFRISGENNVILNWNRVISGITYRVYYNTPGNSTPIEIDETMETSITRPVPNGTYFFWVTSWDGRSESGRSNIVEVRIPSEKIFDDRFTVIFNPNGGSVNTSSKTVSSGTAVGTLPTPVKKGYIFIGWFRTNSGENPVIETTIVDSSFTLYAMWSPIINSRFHTLGISIGTSFSTPLFIGSVYGTYGILQNWFIGFGFDLGLAPVPINKSENFSYENYHSICFYGNVGYYNPYWDSIGFYSSIGVGYFNSKHIFTDGPADFSTPVFDFSAGLIIIDKINIFYTLRTRINFSEANNKFSAGYIIKF